MILLHARHNCDVRRVLLDFRYFGLGDTNIVMDMHIIKPQRSQFTLKVAQYEGKVSSRSVSCIWLYICLVVAAELIYTVM